MGKLPIGTIKLKKKKKKKTKKERSTEQQQLSTTGGKDDTITTDDELLFTPFPHPISLPPTSFIQTRSLRGRKLFSRDLQQ